MNFSEVLNEIIGLTGRPDKTTATATAINAAISLCTMKASFAKDLVETSIPIDGTAYTGTLSIQDLFTRFRKFKYVKAYGAKGYLHPTSPDKVFIPEGFTQRGVYYVGGDTLTYILKTLAPSLEVGYYQYPQVLDVAKNKEHWMLELMPYVIIDLAAAKIFRGIGDDASASRHQASGEEAFKVHRRDYEDLVLAEAK